MTVLSITGKAISRSSVYAKPTKHRNKPRKQRKPRNLSASKPKRIISEQQARAIIDRQIAKKLQRMF